VPEGRTLGGRLPGPQSPLRGFSEGGRVRNNKGVGGQRKKDGWRGDLPAPVRERARAGQEPHDQKTCGQGAAGAGLELQASTISLRGVGTTSCSLPFASWRQPGDGRVVGRLPEHFPWPLMERGDVFPKKPPPPPHLAEKTVPIGSRANAAKTDRARRTLSVKEKSPGKSEAKQERAH